MTKAEQETIIRWDQEERIAHLWTAYEPDARRWEEAGYPVRVFDYAKDGTPRAWHAEVPVEAIRWRKVDDGGVVKRRGHGKGRTFPARTDQLVVSDEGNGAGGATATTLEPVACVR